MKWVGAHYLAALTLVAGGACVFSACVHDDSTIFVRNVMAPKFAAAGTQCTWQADPTQPVISSGALDLALRSQYDAIFLLGNQMVAQVNGNQLQNETSIVKIDGAVVRITNKDGVQLSTYTRLTSSTIAPSVGNVPGYAIGEATIVDPLTLQTKVDPSLHLQQGDTGVPVAVYLSNRGPGTLVRLVTYARFFGKSLGGQSVESNEFEFPIDICNGCLIAFSNNPLYPAPNCVGNAGTNMAMPVIPCVTGQDLVVDCAACQNGNANCRGVYQPVPDAGGGG
jgi:hypothetical protein